MEVKILNSSKTEIEFQVSSLTLAELFRVYLNDDPEIVFAAWKRRHPTEDPILKVKTKSKDVLKVINSTFETISKEIEKFKEDLKKLK